MRISSRKLWMLAAAVVLCIVAIFVITYAGVSKPEAEAEASYYYTTYSSPSQLVAIEIANGSGDVIVAQVDGSYRVYGDYELAADNENAEFFLNLACQLPIEKELEGALASDPQYGLTQPAAEVLIYDVNDNSKMFDLGNATPDGSGYYSCLYGDSRVFIMSADYAEYFFEDVASLFDLSLCQSFEAENTSDLGKLTVSQDGKTLYTLKLTSCSEDGSTVYFEMEEPLKMLLSADQSQKEIMTALRQLKGMGIADITPEEFDVLWNDSIKISTDIYCNNSVRYRVRTVAVPDSELAYIYAEGNSYVYVISSSLLAFTGYSPAELVGSNLVNINASAVAELKLGSVSYTGAELLASDAGRSVLTALNHISVQENYNGQEVAEKVLDIALSTNVSGKAVQLKFYRSENNRYVVSINGVNAFICGTTAVDELLRYSIP